jgi:hypothetical protein
MPVRRHTVNINIASAIFTLYKSASALATHINKHFLPTDMMKQYAWYQLLLLLLPLPHEDIDTILFDLSSILI